MRTSDSDLLNELHPTLRGVAVGVLFHVNQPGKVENGWELRPYCGYRSPEAQLAAYRAGNSQLKHGAHNYKPSRAVDFVWWHPEHGWSWDNHGWWLLGFWAEAAGLTWLGRWGTPLRSRSIEAHTGMAIGRDPAHCELPGWAKRMVDKLKARLPM